MIDFQANMEPAPPALPAVPPLARMAPLTVKVPDTAIRMEPPPVMVAAHVDYAVDERSSLATNRREETAKLVISCCSRL